MAVSGSRISKWMSEALRTKAIFSSSCSFDCTTVSVSVWSGLRAFATSRNNAGWTSTGQPLSASSEAVASTSALLGSSVMIQQASIPSGPWRTRTAAWSPQVRLTQSRTAGWVIGFRS